MQELKDYFKNRQNLTNLIVLLVLVLAVPLGIFLAKNSQVFFSKADRGVPIELGDGPCITDKDNKKIKCSEIPLKLVSPLGPPKESSGSASPSPTASSSAQISPSPTASASPGINPSPTPSSSPSPSSAANALIFTTQPVISISKMTATRAPISFKTNICPSEFIVNYKIQSDTNYTTIKVTGTKCNNSDIQYTLKNLTKKTNYDYFITAKAATNLSTDSSVGTFKTN